MKVLNLQEDHTKQVLIGQQNQTKEFKVSNNAALMKVLSTALYKNPLRSMIREIMFNAWDAHNMGNCKDIPIEVTLNKQAGIIIRDFGPGIHKDMMHPIYCVYGDSTKVEIQAETGGFGLGTKAPFSYTESFTVMSYHGGVKDIYLISKSAEDGDGKPGITSIASVPLIDPNISGLVVSVPIKTEDDVRTAKRYIKKICYLSGMKVKFTYDDEEPVFIDAKEVKPGEVVLDLNRTRMDERLYAVYGGVKYPIEDCEEFNENRSTILDFLGNSNSSLLVGFQPDSLTPLPSREGINLSVQSKNVIAENLKNIVDNLDTNLNELHQMLFNSVLSFMKYHEIPYEFALRIILRLKEPYKIKYEFNNITYVFKHFIQLAEHHKPDDTIWQMVVTEFENSYRSNDNLFHGKDMVNKMFLSYCKIYPEGRQLVYRLRRDEAAKSKYQSTSYITSIADYSTAKCAKALFPFELQMKEEFPKNSTLWPKIRLASKGAWITTARTKRRKPSVSLGSSKKTLKIASKYISKEPELHPSLMWNRIRDTEVCRLFIQNTVILCKTVSQLEYLDKFYKNVYSNSYDISKSFTNGVTYTMLSNIPTYVVPKTKGGHDRARELLVEMGFTVLEANEVPPRTREEMDVKAPSTRYALHTIDTTIREWIDEDSDPIKPSDVGMYIFCKKSDLDTWSDADILEIPRSSWMNLIVEQQKNVVVCHYINQVRTIKKANTKDLSFETYIDTWFKNVAKKKVRFRNLCRMLKVYMRISLSIDKEILMQPEMLKMFNVNVAKGDLKQFIFDMKMLYFMYDSRYYSHNFPGSHHNVKKLIKKTRKRDIKSSEVTIILYKLELLDMQKLERRYVGLSTHVEKKKFLLSLSRFLRTIPYN